jgi:hypothetical protein
MKRAVIALAVFSTTGCFNYGTTPDKFAPAQSPSGARVALRVKGERADRFGELLAVDSIGITIRDGRVVRIAWPRVAALDVAQLDNEYDIRLGEVVTPEKRARLALVSRFPQGLSALPITIDSLISQAVRETRVFADRRSAIDAGYRRVGADFPGMGEHWLNVRALLKGTIDPARPTLLIYAEIRGRPTLLGIGFAVATHGDSVPRDLPGWPENWHEHSGLLAEESGARTGDSGETSDTHLWVMHGWTVLKNPQGTFAADNWALPYARAGRAVPTHVDPAASRGLALTVGGDEFVRKLLTDSGLRTDDNARLVDSLTSAARLRALASADDHALRAAWRTLCDDVTRTLGPRAAALLEPTHTGIHE